MKPQRAALPPGAHLLALVTVIVSVAGATVGAALMAPAPVTQGATEAPELAELARELARLRAVLEGFEERAATVELESPTPAVGAATRAPAVEDGRVVEALERIRELLERPAAGGGTAVPALAAAPRPVRTEVDWEGLEQAVEERRANPDEGLAPLVLWTYADLLERYGRPSEVWSKDGQVFWNYLAAPADLGGREVDLTLKFVDGRVTNMWYAGE